MSLECPYCGFENNDDAIWCAKCNRNMIDWTDGNPNQDVRQVDGASGEPVDRLWLSILLTIFCCQILGIVAIVYSVIARVEKERGHREYAVSASKSAALWSTWTFITGIVAWIAVLLVKTSL